MNPYVTLAIAAVALGALPTWRVMRRQRRQSAVSHLPGHRTTPGGSGAEHGDVANTLGRGNLNS